MRHSVEKYEALINEHKSLFCQLTEAVIVLVIPEIVVTLVETAEVEPEEVPTVVVALTPLEVEVDVLTANPLPIELTVVHWLVAGAGWAAGVTGSPWWKVEAPYTPIGSSSSASQLSKTPES